MKSVKNPLVMFLMRYMARLRFPQLFAVTAVVFVVDVLVPDMIPFVDEILLGLLMVLLGSLNAPGGSPPRPAG